MIALLRLLLLPATLLLSAHPVLGVEQTGRPEPGVPRLNRVQFDTQDYVISTHDVRDYGATANNQSDDTEVFQKAIDACEQDGGGVIFVPAGRYVFRNRLVLKSGVYLRGEWRNPETGPAAGTLLCIYYGKGEADALPFISMGYSSGLKDLALWYPEQSFEDPVPYAWTIQQISGMSAGLENLTIYNAWQGIQTGPQGNQLMTIKNLFMTALHIGFLRDSVYDCQKLQRIRMSPRYWTESGLLGAPAEPQENVKLRRFLLSESTGAVLTHYDWTWMYDWRIEGFHTGIRTQRSLVKTEDRGPNGGFVNLKLIDNFIGMEIGDINRCGWADTEVLIRSSLKNAVGIKVTAPLKSVAQFLNVSFEGTFQYCVLSEASYGCITMAGCTFNNWSEDGWDVYAESGVIGLFQNSFNRSSKHVYLGNRVQSAALIGNRFAGSPAIENDASGSAEVMIDHTFQDLKMCDLSAFDYPEAIDKPKKAELFNVRDFGALGDGTTDDHVAFARALKAAGDNGGGTVYVPAGQYVLKEELTVPEHTELRGVFDNCHHTIGYAVRNGKSQRNGQRGSEILAYPGRGEEDGTPFITLKHAASLRGLTLVYPEQKWSDYLETKTFTPYPWTLQSQGRNVRLKDVLLVNSYRGADFGTYDSTGHRIDYLCGTVLKTGLSIDNCFGKGYVKNVQWNPSFWGWSKYNHGPGGRDGSRVVRDAVKHTLTSFVLGYAEQENMLQNFSFGSKTGIEFINNPKHGGVNGTLIAHGVDYSATSMIVNDVGKDAQFVNFQIVSMDVEARRRYLDIKDAVKGRAEFYSLLGWGHDPCTETGIEMESGDFYFLLSSLASFGLDYGIKQTGGKLQAVGMRFGEAIESPIAGGYRSGRYGYFGEGIDKADLIGAIKKKGSTVGEAFESKAGSKLRILHSIQHDGY
ncbi:glycosyl hydrolase family 28-related protein [Novipirellula artificiosorum]|uniref:Pectate lyase superfamily protein n=1 Tax=Novipirellula artificiosorum TaxID=2528016 RepID=A0A5C6DLL0_9BACT|nr:glycosyl hydrolase family 28-related protein [Novipirellula artificiosorum]TWU38283.1 Pectate lyase superfamily protein [Novipirellula artificiosorum]